MWKLVFIAAALCLSASPLDAAAKDGRRIEKTQRGDQIRRDPVRRDDARREDLRRDVERISREIYPQRRR